MPKRDIAQRKGAVRARMLERRTRQTGIQRASRSRRICLLVSRLSVFRRAKVVALFHPFRGEVDVLSLFRIARRAGKKVVFPRVEGREIIAFYRVDSLSGLEKSRYGIMEPPRDASRCIKNPGLYIVPGSAFSGKGDRLGYGGGYYDRILKNCSAVSVGVAFGFQLAPSLPVGLHDACMDAVVTEDRVYFCGPFKGRLGGH